MISNQARFRCEQVTFAGKATTWVRTAESGNALTFHFCPICADGERAILETIAREGVFVLYSPEIRNVAHMSSNTRSGVANRSIG